VRYNVGLLWKRRKQPRSREAGRNCRQRCKWIVLIFALSRRKTQIDRKNTVGQYAVSVALYHPILWNVHCTTTNKSMPPADFWFWPRAFEPLYSTPCPWAAKPVAIAAFVISLATGILERMPRYTDKLSSLHKLYFKINIWAKPNVSPPGAVSPTVGDLGDWNFPVAKSRGPNSNALAYAERALST